MFKWELISTGLLRLVADLLLFTVPFFFYLFVGYLDNEENEHLWKGIALASLIFVALQLHSFMLNYSSMVAQQVGVQVRATLSTVVYKKVSSNSYCACRAWLLLWDWAKPDYLHFTKYFLLNLPHILDAPTYFKHPRKPATQQTSTTARVRRQNYPTLICQFTHFLVANLPIRSNIHSTLSLSKNRLFPNYGLCPSVCCL